MNTEFIRENLRNGVQRIDKKNYLRLELSMYVQDRDMVGQRQVGVSRTFMASNLKRQIQGKLNGLL